jgi:hypothetical protein
MASLNEIVKEVVSSYASGGLNLRTYPLSNEEKGIYAVNVIDWPQHRRPVGVVVLAHVEGDKVIIEEDLTDRRSPLVDALVAAGVAKEQIVLKYREDALTRELYKTSAFLSRTRAVLTPTPWRDLG